MAEQVRDCIQRWEPDLTESIRWNCLCYSGRKLICGLSACRHHLGITFFRGTELKVITGLFDPEDADNATTQTIRVTSLEQLNRRALRELLHAAVALDAQGDLPKPPPVKREEWPMPPALAAGLKKSKAAAAFFESLAPTYQREYKVWIGTAKRPETIEKRLKETLAALSAGRKWAQRKG